MNNKFCWSPLQVLEIILVTWLFSHSTIDFCPAKKFTNNYKTNIYMTHGTLNIYIYDTQHLQHNGFT